MHGDDDETRKEVIIIHAIILLHDAGSSTLRLQ